VTMKLGLDTAAAHLDHLQSLQDALEARFGR
jgi:hypothetical protein